MNPNMKKVVTRFPPSPTGNLHIGGVRTALFNYLFARHHGGSFLLRIEDTDKERSKKEYETNILESLTWLGLQHDNKTIPRQSERNEIYKKYLKQLVDSGKAFVSKETEGERKEVIRFKNPKTTIAFDDLIRGKVSFDTAELGDFVIAKSFEEPIYHIAAVIDDFETGVTHVIRGEDHISNTPRQILIQEALGFPRPVYAHLPLILAADRSKLSKRHGSVSLTEYRDKGYVKEAILNYLALLGWNPGTEQEIFTLDELIKDFDLDKVQKAGAIFSEEKLRWVNKEHIKKMTREAQEVEVGKWLGKKGDMVKRIRPVIIDRIEIFGDIRDMKEKGELTFYFEEPKFPPKKLLWKGLPAQAGEGDLVTVKKHLVHVASILEKISDKDFTAETIKSAIWPYAESEGRGAVLWPLRFALSGKDKSPDPFTLCAVLGKKIAISRINEAVKLCA